MNTRISDLSKPHHPFPSSNTHLLSSPSILDSDPGDRDHDIHALLLRRLPLVAVCSVLLVVPEGTDSAVHAAAAVLLWF